MSGSNPLPSSSSSRKTGGPSLPVTIRPATPADTETIIALIRALAIYEKEPDAAKATPELVRENIFEREYAQCVLAEGEYEGKTQVLGMAIYFFSFSTWTACPSLYLEDLYVVPEARNRSVGKALFRHLGHVAQQRKCQRIDWSVLDWNVNSIAFYKEVLGAKPMDGWTGMRLEGDEAIARLQQLGKEV